MAACILAGLGAATFIDLPTGDVVANIEGAINATTLTCNVINDEGVQLTTTWSVANFKGELGIRPLSIVDTLHIWWRSNPQHNLHVFEPNNYCKLDVCFGWCDTVLWHWWRSRSSKCFLEDLS